MGEFYYNSLLTKIKKNTRNIMCKKLRELSTLSAEQILELYGELKAPIDIEKILKCMNVSYSEMDFSDIENEIPNVIKQKGKILGAVTIIDDDVNIFYSEGSSRNRIRFTLAHELAHCCLNASNFDNEGHIEFRFDEKSNEPEELAANIFAGKLLIPKSLLMKEYKSMIIPLSDSLARTFDVSTQVMEARLKYLELPFYSPETV